MKTTAWFQATWHLLNRLLTAAMPLVCSERDTLPMEQPHLNNSQCTFKYSNVYREFVKHKVFLEALKPSSKAVLYKKPQTQHTNECGTKFFQNA